MDGLLHEDGRTFVRLVSRSRSELPVKPLATDGTLHELDGAAVGTVTLPGYGVRILEMRPS